MNPRCKDIKQSISLLTSQPNREVIRKTYFGPYKTFVKEFIQLEYLHYFLQPNSTGSVPIATIIRINLKSTGKFKICHERLRNTTIQDLQDVELNVHNVDSNALMLVIVTKNHIKFASNLEIHYYMYLP